MFRTRTNVMKRRRNRSALRYSVVNSADVRVKTRIWHWLHERRARYFRQQRHVRRKKIRSSTSTIHRLHPLTTWSFAPATGVVMRWWEVKHTAKRRKWKKNTYTWPTRLNWNILQHWCQAYHHTVLPPSEFYGTITDPLHVYSESCRPNRFYSAMLCIARTMLSQDVRPSVSHTPVFTAKHIVKLFSPPGNHAILVFFPSSRQYSDGDPLTGALNAKRCEKNRDIQPISRFISEMMLNKTMVTMEGE